MRFPALSLHGRRTVWIDLSKGLGCPAGAGLVGSADLIHEARRCKHLFGGAMRQAGIIAAAGVYALEHHVECLAEGILEIPALELEHETVESYHSPLRPRRIEANG